VVPERRTTPSFTVSFTLLKVNDIFNDGPEAILNSGVRRSTKGVRGWGRTPFSACATARFGMKSTKETEIDQAACEPKPPAIRIFSDPTETVIPRSLEISSFIEMPQHP
jgi:hypothetical protein